MKRSIITLLSIFSFFLAATPVFASSLAKPPNNLGLVSYWSFNDGVGASATDSSGKGNTGILTNGPAFVAGKVGKAISFDGSDDYVDAGDQSTLRIEGAPFTLSAWVLLNSQPGVGIAWNIIGKGQGGAAGYGLQYVNDSGTYKITLTKYSVVDQLVNQTFATGIWYHVVAVQGASSVQYFINGVSIGSYSNASAYSSSSGFNFQIGRRTDSGSFWNGSIDEVRVYNRALGATEVAALYNNTRKVTAKAVSNNNLLASWSFDDATGTLATDSSGKGNTGTLTNGPTWVQGKHNKALSFDGSDDYVISSNSAFITSTEQAHSVFAWVKTPANVNQVVWDYGEVNDSDCASSLQIRSDGHLVHDTNGSSFTPTFAIDSNLVVPANQWTFVGFTHDAALGVTLYVNGQSFSGSSPGCGSVGFNPHVIGLGFQNTSPAGYFSGTIDDLLAYNRTLSAAEVATLYQSGSAKINASQNTKSTSGLIGLWSFNGQDVRGTVAYDRSGQGNNGTITGGPRAVPGKVGQGFEFSNSKSIVLSTSAFDLTSSSFTISAWFKTVSTGSNLGIYTKSGASSRIKLYQTGGSTLRFRLVNSSAVGVSIDTSGININDGAWHQVAATFDFSNAAGVVYIDGVSRGSGTGPSGDLDASPSVHLLGQGDGGNAESWNGSLDELRIYNRALTAAEVLQLYTQSK